MAMDYNEIERALAAMKPQQRLYNLVRNEMKKRGRWKYLGRGKPVINNLKGVGTDQTKDN